MCDRFQLSHALSALHNKNICDIIFSAGQPVDKLFVIYFSVLVNQLINYL